MTRKIHECTICGCGEPPQECERILVRRLLDVRDSYSAIWLCDECFDHFPAELCSIERDSGIGSEVKIFIKPDAFPNIDTYCMFLECTIGSGSFRTRKGIHIYQILSGICERKHAARQLKIYITNDWGSSKLDLSSATNLITGLQSDIVYEDVNFNFLAGLFWRGNRWGYTPNQVRVCLYQYANNEVFNFVVGTDDEKIDRYLYSEFGGNKERCKIVDEVMTFDNVDKAVKKLFWMYLYIRNNDYCSYRNNSRWAYMSMYLQNRRYETNGNYEFPNPRVVTRLVYEGERV